MNNEVLLLLRQYRTDCQTNPQRAADEKRLHHPLPFPKPAVCLVVPAEWAHLGSSRDLYMADDTLLHFAFDGHFTSWGSIINYRLLIGLHPNNGVEFQYLR